MLFPREAGFEVRLARSSLRVRVLKREDVIARITIKSAIALLGTLRPLGGVADKPECGGLENRYPSLGGSRVQIPPPPLRRETRRPAGFVVLGDMTPCTRSR